MKRKRCKVKNAVLKTITAIASVTLMLSMCAVGDGIVEAVIFLASLGWLYAFGLANNWFELEDDWR